MDLIAGEYEVNIEEVVLEGGHAASRDAVAQAIRAQLAKLLVQQPPALTASLSVAHMDAGMLGVSVQAAPATVGAAIATSLHGGLSR